MRTRRFLCAIVFLLSSLTSTVPPLGATTLIRAGLDVLSASNPTVVMGEVVDAYSYWNSGGTFILTDVRFAVLDVIKGRRDKKNDLTITLMGGTVGDLTVLIPGGAELIPGASYVLFLDEADLPGAEHVLTVRDHCQGAFEMIADAEGELRAVSQASGHPLVPDAQGSSDAPGGFEGLPLATMIRSIRDFATSQESTSRR
jgi:hypothetical protein